MEFTERLKVVIDVVSSGATKGIGDFRTEVAKADTFTGKLRAGTRTLSSTFSSFIKSPAGAATAVTAVTTAAIAAADKFAALAKESIDLGKAVGTTTENASRWIAVADDAGLSADNLQVGLKNISKSLDSDKWATYGITTRDAAGNARDSSDIFLDVLDMLNNTPNAADKARIGTELLGKGWQSISPLLGKSKAEYEDLLATVSDGQVITAGEAEKAEKWRLAQDKLSDSFGDVALSAGDVAASLAPVLSGLADLISFVPKVLKIAGVADTSGEAFATFSKELDNTGNTSGDVVRAFGKLASESFKTGGTIEGMQKILTTPLGESFADTALRMMTETLRELAATAPEDAKAVFDVFTGLMVQADRGSVVAQEYLKSIGFTMDTWREWSDIANGSASATDNATEATENLTDAEKDATDAAKRHSDEILRQIELTDELYGREYSRIERLMALQDAQQDMTETLADSEASLRDQRDAVMEVTDKFAGLNGATEGSREYINRQIESLTMFMATIDSNSPLYKALADYLRLLNAIPPTVNTKLNISTPSGASFKLGFGSGTYNIGASYPTDSPYRALGGPVSANSMYQVAEGGMPELLTDGKGRTYLIPGTDGVVTPISSATASTSAVGGQTFNITITNPLMSGEQLANELKAYIRRNGSGWLS